MSAYAPQSPNPYAAPPVSGNYNATPGYGPPGGEAPPALLVALDGTRPWARFLSVIAFIGAGFSVLGGLGMIVAGAAGGSSNDPRMAGLSGAGGVVAGIFYFLIAAFYVYVGLQKNRFVQAIESALYRRDLDSVTSAMECSRVIWRMYGVMVIGMFALGVIGFFAAIAIAVAGAPS